RCLGEQRGAGALVPAELDAFRRFGDSLRELRCEEALEVAARQQLALDPLRELAILDRDGGDAGEPDAELEVLVAEPVGGRDVVDVENAERFAFAPDERDADRRANLLHENRLAAEARVFSGVVGENSDFVVEGSPRDRLRYGAR